MIIDRAFFLVVSSVNLIDTHHRYFGNASFIASKTSLQTSFSHYRCQILVQRIAANAMLGSDA
jgi:hypothetical protein